jgi:hypothetical protein
LLNGLEEAHDQERSVLGLTVPERGTILRALADGDRDTHLVKPLGVLFREHERRVCDGLVQRLAR